MTGTRAKPFRANRGSSLGSAKKRAASSPAVALTIAVAALTMAAQVATFSDIAIWPFVNGALRQLRIPAALRAIGNHLIDVPELEQLINLRDDVSWVRLHGWMVERVVSDCGRHRRATGHAQYSLKMVTSSMRWARISLRSRSMTAGSAQGCGRS